MKKIYFLLTVLITLSIQLNAQNNCLDFDGTDDYVEVSSSSALNFGTGDFTISLWLKSSLTSDGMLVEKIWDSQSTLGGNGWAIQLQASGRFKFSISDTYEETPTVFQSIDGNTWNDGEWHHLAIVVDRSSNVSFYINGIADRVGDVSSESGSLSNTYPLLIGINYNKNATKDLQFDGLIDEVRIWNDVRTQAEIRANMYKELIGTESNLVAYYKFNETSGTNADDSKSGGTNDGTLTNMTNDDWVTSPAFFGPKNCLDFDGTNDYVDCGNDASLDITDAITICAWIIPGDGIESITENDTIWHYQAIVEKDSYYNETYALLVKKDIHYIKFPLKLDGVEHIHAGYGPVEELWDGNFHHIAATYDKNGGNDNYLIYVDGVLVHTDTLTGSIGTKPTNSLTVGGHSYDGNLFEGKIDEVQIWNIALTARQIRENMCKSLVGDESGLVAYYNFDNTLGMTLQDFSGNDNDGTLTNMENDAWISSSSFNTWLNTDDSDWATASNWSNGVPSSTDNVGVYNYTSQPSSSADLSVKNLVVGTGASLNVSSNTLTTTGDIFNFGTLTVNSGLTNSGTSSTFINEGTLANNGTSTLNDFSNNSGATATVNSGKTMIINGDLINSGTFTINAGSETNNGSLIVNGTSTGNVTYNRWMTADKWHIVSAPVETQDISDVLTNVSGTNSIALNGSDYGVTDYLEPTNEWGTYFTNGTAGSFTSGKGYLMRRQTDDGTVSFTGTVADADFGVTLSKTETTGYGWNALGNPFTSAINVTDASGDATNNLLQVNTDVLEDNFVALYVWDEQGSYTTERNDYKVINNAGAGGTLGQHFIQAGQGFIVKAKTDAATFSFTRAMQSHQTTTPFKSAEISEWADINIVVSNSEISTKTRLKFNEQMTNGLDIGYDAGILKGNPDFSLYTQLIEDNGVEFMLQCLSLQNLEMMEISVGLDAAVGGEITLSIQKENFPSSLIPVLNDKLLNTQFVFNSESDVYTTTINDNTKGFGRFTLTFSSTTDVEDIMLGQAHFRAWYSNGLLNISGEIIGEGQATVYDINGRKLAVRRLMPSGQNQIRIPTPISGIYLIKVEDAKRSEVLKVVKTGR